MAIDYEVEYNNRARVPEHPQIFARWAREAEDYRAQAMQERRAELGLMYGSTLRQFIDLFAPRPEVIAPLALYSSSNRSAVTSTARASEYSRISPARV